MITEGVNYVRQPHKAKELTRQELVEECDRLDNLACIFGERDWEVADEYKAQVLVLEKILLNCMALDEFRRIG